jgi:hypothetical protein
MIKKNQSQIYFSDRFCKQGLKRTAQLADEAHEPVFRGYET